MHLLCSRRAHGGQLRVGVIVHDPVALRAVAAVVHESPRARAQRLDLIAQAPEKLALAPHCHPARLCRARPVHRRRACSTSARRQASKSVAEGGSLFHGRHKDVCGLLFKWRQEVVKGGKPPAFLRTDLLAFLRM
jgi:hypothetical protein